MAYLTHHSINILSICRPTSPLDPRLTKREAQLYDAYLGNLDAAKALGSKSHLYQDAWLNEEQILHQTNLKS